MVLVPTLGPLVAGTDEGAQDLDTDITPPDYAFVIWAPIFAGVTANAIQHALRPQAVANRRTGWWLVGAYGLNAAWSLAAQADRIRVTPGILCAAAASALVAHRRVQGHVDDVADRVVSGSTSLLAGWTSLAALVDTVAVAASTTASPRPRTSAAARLGLAGAAAGVSATVATTGDGALPLAAAAVWGLATTTADGRRTPTTRAVAGAGAGTIAAAAIRASRRARC